MYDEKANPEIDLKISIKAMKDTIGEMFWDLFRHSLELSYN